MDLYFERHDGDAATVEDFVRCFEDASGRKLEQFRLWYSQAGTPEVQAEGAYDPKAKTYALDLKQSVPPTPGQAEKKPMHIPLALGLIGKRSAKPLPLTLEGENETGPNDRVVELVSPEQRFVFTGVAEEPVLSLGRDFSAPVIIRSPQDAATRAFLMSHDADAFNRWEAGQKLSTEILVGMIRAIKAGRPAVADPTYVEAIGAVIARADEDHAFTALMLVPPSESELALAHTPIDPEAIHDARRRLIWAIADAHGPALAALYTKLESRGAFSPDAASAGRRALRNSALRFLSVADDDYAAELAETHYRSATNITEMTAGLAALARTANKRREQAFADFHERFRDDPLVLDKWMGLQAMSPQPDTVDRVRALMGHKVFSLEESQPRARPDRRFRNRKSVAVPRPVRRRLPACPRGGAGARFDQSADRGAYGGGLRDLATLRSRASASDAHRTRGHRGASGAVGQPLRDGNKDARLRPSFRLEWLRLTSPW